MSIISITINSEFTIIRTKISFDIVSELFNNSYLGIPLKILSSIIIVEFLFIKGFLIWQ